MNVYPQPMLNHFLRRGWAVTMTDYEGLGTTDRTHPFLLGESAAHGVLDIVRTGRLLFGSRMSDRFAIVGHSQGGQAALFAAHHAQEWTPELELAGVAATAPANHPLGLVRAGAITDEAPTPEQPNGGFAFTPLFLSGAMGGDTTIRADQVLSARAYRDLWPQVEQRCRAGLSEYDSWGGLRGVEQFRLGYPLLPNQDQRNFDRQLTAMNPDVTITVPIRISQAADDERVLADPQPLLGTDALVRELAATNSASGNTVTYQRYDEGAVTPDEELGVHFGTISHDLPALTRWLDRILGKHK